jgi:hypothetical protein
MLDWNEKLNRWTRRTVRELVSAEGRRARKEALLVAWPLALRRIRRDKARTLLFSLCVAASVCIYLLFSAFAAATTQRAVSGVEDLQLPCDILLVSGPESFSPADVRAVDRAPQVRTLETGYWFDALTQAGRLPLVGLKPGARAMGGFGAVLAGRMPQAAGEVALPEQVAALVTATPISSSRGFALGSEFGVRYVSNTGQMSEKVFTVSGVYRPVSDFATCVLVPASDALDITRSEPNAMFAFLSEGAFLDDAENRARSEAPGARIYSARTPERQMRGLVASVLSPSNLALLFVFCLSGLGILNLQLLSFLRRKRDIGVLRALGMDSREAGLLLFLEGLLLAVVGTILGTVLAYATTARLAPVLPYRLAIGTWAPLWAAVYSFIVFAISTWLPVTLSSRATVDQLLYNRRVYLNPNLSCAHCGRCGGF